MAGIVTVGHFAGEDELLGHLSALRVVAPAHSARVVFGAGAETIVTASTLSRTPPQEIGLVSRSLKESDASQLRRPIDHASSNCGVTIFPSVL